MNNKKIAMNLLKIAHSLIAMDDKEQLVKKFENQVIGGKTPDEIKKNDEAYAKLCKEWEQKFPEECHPAPGIIENY